MRFFTSDSHFSHERILVLGTGRPFTSVGHMNRALIENAWRVMSDDDELYHLGDAAMGNFDESVKLLAQMPGRKKFLVPGNHDKVFPRLNSANRIARFTPMYEEAGYEVLNIHELITLDLGDRDHREVRLSHVPYSPERFEGSRGDKLAFARPVDDGKWLIHGHTHSTEKLSSHPREIHVGVDANNWTPVSEQAIIERIKESEKNQGEL